MKIIIPMAGIGKRMRPHTLTTPKPLIRLAGATIVEHLVAEISKAVKEPIDEIAFVMGHFGEEAEQAVIKAAEKVGARASIYYQEEALGTAHAILCAADSLKGPVVVAFADTIIYCSKPLNLQHDSVIWTMKVEDPSAFGVVLTDANGRITGFKEKPKEFVSDQAIIGIYFFKDGENLRRELQYLIDNDIRRGKEYQLTDALQNMMEKGLQFYSEQVDQWLDCGNKDATIDTHSQVLKHQGHYVSPTAVIENSTIHEPCHIEDGAVIRNATVGPYVTVGAGSLIENGTVQESILQENVKVSQAAITRSMLGREACVKLQSAAGEKYPALNLSLSDYSVISL